MDKAFFVSPFIDVDGRYAVHVRDEPDGVRLAIALRQDGQPLLSTSLVLRRVPLTDRSLLRMLVRYPLLTHRTIALIHWHALRLWLRGAPFFRHGAASGSRRDEHPASPRRGGSAGRAGGLLERGRAAGDARRGARRIRVGRLTVVLPDGSRHDVRRSGVGDGRRDPRPRHRRRRADARWAATSAPARPTWTGCGRARTCRRCSRSPRSTARRSRCPTAGGGCRCGCAGRRPPDAPQHEGRQPPQHRGPLRPRQRLLPPVPRRDA